MWIEADRFDPVPVSLRSERSHAFIGFLLRAELTAASFLMGRVAQLETDDHTALALGAAAGVAAAISMVRAERRLEALDATIAVHETGYLL